MRKDEIIKKFKNLSSKSAGIISVSNKEWYSLFLDEIRNSIAIEGIFADRNDLLSVIEKSNKSYTQKTDAILGYFETASSVYEYARNLYKNNEFTIRQSDIKQIHSLLMRYEKLHGFYKGPLGDYRKENVEVYNSRFTPVSYRYVNDLMTAYIKWINKQIRLRKNDKIRLAALSHVLLETIHPFRDGNGRVGRIFLSFILIGNGFMNIAIKGVRKNERERYYLAMEKSDDEFEKMLRRIEKGEAPSSALIDEYSRKTNTEILEEIILDELELSYDRLQHNNADEADKEALLPLRDASKYFNYSQDYLRNLLNSGNLKGMKKGKLWYIKLSDLETYVNKISSNILKPDSEQF